MKKFASVAIQLALLSAIPAVSDATTPNIDVAVVAFVSGPVTVHAENQPEFALKPFSRVRLEDQIDLPAGSALKIIYLQSGRAEFWSGAAQFRAGGVASEAIKGAPEVTNLPSTIRQTIARAPDLTRISPIGGVTIRGGLGPKSQPSMTLNEIRKMYLQLRKELPDTDMTAELFLISATAEYVQSNPVSPSK
jgi:hypothetical protein